MSTALVSPLSDVSDVLLQNGLNQHNLVNSRGQLNWGKMLTLLNQHGGDNAFLPPTCGGDRTRNSSGGSSSSSSGSSSGGKYGPASPQHLISFPREHPGLQQQQQQQQQPPQMNRGDFSSVPHRKLDRSISEPADRNNNSHSAQAAAQARQNENPKNVNSTRYKTELCRPFEENGFCKYGDKCQFAHGENELRNLNRHPKYKTELCRTFHSVGFCPYGPRCHFIHNEDERKLSQISHLKHTQAAQQAQQHQHQQLQVVQQLLAQAQQQSAAAGSMPRSAPQAMQRPGSATANPKALNFSLSLPPMVRDTLGSTADSPPSSLRGSPTMSPISMLSDPDSLMGSLGSGSSSAGSTLSGFSMFSSNSTPPPQSAPPGFSNTFTFPQPTSTGPSHHQDMAPVMPPTPPVMTPLNVQTMPQDAIASLAAEMQAASLQSSLQQLSHPSNTTTSEVLRECGQAASMFSMMPPSPPHSLEGDSSPLANSPPSGSPLDLSRGLRLPIFSQLATPDN